MKAVVSVRGFDELPDELAEAKRLSPWAVATRYDDIDASLDRSAAVQIAEQSLSWARERVDAARAESKPQSMDHTELA